MASRVIRVTIRASLLGVVVYGVTRIVPVHRLLPSASQIKSFVQSAMPLPSKWCLSAFLDLTDDKWARNSKQHQGWLSVEMSTQLATQKIEVDEALRHKRNLFAVVEFPLNLLRVGDHPSSISLKTLCFWLVSLFFQVGVFEAALGQRCFSFHIDAPADIVILPFLTVSVYVSSSISDPTKNNPHVDFTLRLISLVRWAALRNHYFLRGSS